MTGQDGATVTHMQMADIAVVEIGACMATSTEKPHPGTDLCAVIPLTAGVCYGDSGGPLLAIDPLSGEHRLAGLTSRGGTVCTVEPGVFTSMSAPAVWDWDWDQPR